MQKATANPLLFWLISNAMVVLVNQSVTHVLISYNTLTRFLIGDRKNNHDKEFFDAAKFVGIAFEPSL